MFLFIGVCITVCALRQTFILFRDALVLPVEAARVDAFFGGIGMVIVLCWLVYALCTHEDSW